MGLQAIGLFAEANGAVVVVVGIESALLVGTEEISEPLGEVTAQEGSQQMYIGQSTFPVVDAVNDVMIDSYELEERFVVPCDT